MNNAADTHLARLADDATRRTLADLDLEWGVVDQNVCAALRFGSRVADAPRIVGLVGGASSGKSTIFNSLVGRPVSLCSAHAHETTGAVAAVPAGRNGAVWLDPTLLMPGLDHRDHANHEPTVGRPGTLILCEQDRPMLEGTLLVDTPDVTSKMSADEGAVTRSLLPWFDGVIVVVDEERWFDATVLAETTGLSRRLGAHVWIVFNRNESGVPLGAAERRKLARHADALGARGHAVSEYQPGSGYRPIEDAARSHILAWLDNWRPTERRPRMLAELHARCTAVVNENLTRSEQFARLTERVRKSLADLDAATSLTRDLLTTEECRLLGLGHRVVPLYEMFVSAKRHLRRWTRPGGDRDVEFEKTPDELAAVLRRNLEQRFGAATQRLERLIADSDYTRPMSADWQATWELPRFDEQEWARRIRVHIDAWKAEHGAQSKRGDAAAVVLGAPLLLADLLFLGGAGMTLTWTAASIAGFLGVKGVSSLVQRSPAFGAYQTTVRAYQSLVRESLAEQCDRNLAAIPRRHLPMSAALLESLMHWSLEVQAR